MINRYLFNLEQLVNSYDSIDYPQFSGPNRKKADFDDLVWYHTDPDHSRKIRYLCTIFDGKLRRSDNELTHELALMKPYDHLLKVWIIIVVNQSISAAHKQFKVIEARKVLSRMRGHLYEQTQSSLTKLLAECSAPEFIKLCMENKLLKTFHIKYPKDTRDRTGHGHHAKQLKKLPNESSILALGEIFQKVFNRIENDGSTKHLNEISISDALTLTWCCLSLASPNRTRAECAVLSKQKLNSYSLNDGEKVFYLEWKGSKGHKDNKTHILKALSEPLNKAINFFYYYCEPARALCRYYHNPNQSLKSLLGDFTVGPHFLSNLSLKKKPNLFQLGYALGFYDKNEKIYVLNEGYQSQLNRLQQISPIGNKGYCSPKPIHALEEKDVVYIAYGGNSSFKTLFGVNLNFNSVRKTSPTSIENGWITISDLENWWIEYFKKEIIPEFPLSFTDSETCADLSRAMFVILSRNIAGSIKSRLSGIYGSTYYSVASLSYLGQHVSRRMTGTNIKSHRTESIFEDYGFSKELIIRLHQIRHFGNTLADQSNIPIGIISMWSGRVDREQTYTYIHTSEDEKADRVKAIINPQDNKSVPIRVISSEEIHKTLNLPASVTSTGICTQDLTVTPCQYLNDFTSQCFMCSEVCHVAGDNNAISFLQKDHDYQKQRLEIVASDPRIKNSLAMQDWYLFHARNTSILRILIELMTDSPQGTIIRYVNRNDEFKLTDLKSKQVSIVKISLPNFAENLKKLLATNITKDSEEDSNMKLLTLMSSFGLKPQDY